LAASLIGHPGPRAASPAGHSMLASATAPTAIPVDVTSLRYVGKRCNIDRFQQPS
jgi:hypothetical protein